MPPLTTPPWAPPERTLGDDLARWLRGHRVTVTYLAVSAAAFVGLCLVDGFT
jgi:hypothetical protein